MLQNFTVLLCLWLCLTMACRQSAKKETSALPAQKVEKPADENPKLSERTELPPAQTPAEQKQPPATTTTSPPPKTTTPTPKETGKTESSHFSLVSATAQTWTAGVASGGKGTDYYLSVNITTDEPLSFQSLWIDGKVFTLSVGAAPGTAVGSQSPAIKKGSTVTLRATELINNKGQSNAQTAQPPVTHSGAALMSYTVNGKAEYFTIPTIERKKTDSKQ